MELPEYKQMIWAKIKTNDEITEEEGLYVYYGIETLNGLFPFDHLNGGAEEQILDWRPKFDLFDFYIREIESLSNKDLYLRVLEDSGGDDYDEGFTTIGLEKWILLQKEFENRLKKIGFLSE